MSKIDFTRDQSARKIDKFPQYIPCKQLSSILLLAVCLYYRMNFKSLVTSVCLLMTSLIMSVLILQRRMRLNLCQNLFCYPKFNKKPLKNCPLKTSNARFVKKNFAPRSTSMSTLAEFIQASKILSVTFVARVSI